MEKDMYEKAWAGEHGKDYVDRCQVTSESRKAIFEKIFRFNTKSFRSVLEVGCNKGHNLDAIRGYGDYNVVGVEINKTLCTRPDIINGSAYDLPWQHDVFELTFTAGVLIHIPPGRLHEAMDEMRRVSKKYVMMIEYFAEKETGTKYQKDFNFQDGVWARPYGGIYQGHYPKDQLIASGKIGDIGDDGWGFSKCDYWIFEKKS